jgi:NAD(P)-dependent dehydrogenase (short-subunit alcohol dehydrogenase family)
VVAADVADDGAVAAMVDMRRPLRRPRLRGEQRRHRADAKPFVEHSLAEWQRTIDIDLTGVFLCMQHELRRLAQGRGARSSTSPRPRV